MLLFPAKEIKGRIEQKRFHHIITYFVTIFFFLRSAIFLIHILVNNKKVKFRKLYKKKKLFQEQHPHTLYIYIFCDTDHPYRLFMINSE